MPPLSSLTLTSKTVPLSLFLFSHLNPTPPPHIAITYLFLYLVSYPTVSLICSFHPVSVVAKHQKPSPHVRTVPGGLRLQSLIAFSWLVFCLAGLSNCWHTKRLVVRGTDPALYKFLRFPNCLQRRALLAGRPRDTNSSSEG